MNKYQEALNRIKTAPSFMGGTDLYKTHLNSSELFLQDIATLQELVDKATPKKPIIKNVCNEVDGDVDYGACPNCEYPLDYSFNYCPNCGQKLDWSDDDDI